MQFNSVGSSIENTPADTEPNTVKKCPCPHGKYTVAAVVILIVLGIICFHIHPKKPATPAPGTICKIRFCRNVLGGAEVSASPLTDNVNGIYLNLVGELIAVTPDFVIVRRVVENITTNGKHPVHNLWIPWQNILLIEYEERDSEHP
ncbi:hypothetical protein FACS189454_03940 [Planctomycetales bacterium]|nr:hypothetical protein FACS189454_03940 [Planctomycetales bacterium]